MTATGTTTTTTTAATTTANHVPFSQLSSVRQAWTCNNCQVSFENGQAQREHMRSPWHVYNIKRRIVSLPSISLTIFNTRLQPAPVAVKNVSKNAISCLENDVASPYRCLFCHQKFTIDDQGLKSNLVHMSTVHGLFVPDVAMISDLESFLGYLSTIVREWHECLYCGVTKDSTIAVQSHMRDIGHCKLNLDMEPELLDFWEYKSKVVHEKTAKHHSIELVPSFDRSIASKPSYRRRAKATRAKGICPISRSVSTHQNPPMSSKHHDCHQVVRRDELGIQNIGVQQRQALVLAVKRSQKEEAVALRESEWSYAKKANKQKHDQSHGPLSWAKGGMHNLLPR